MNALTDFILDHASVADLAPGAAPMAADRIKREFRGPDRIWMKRDPWPTIDIVPAELPDFLPGDANAELAYQNDFDARKLVARGILRAPIAGKLSATRLARELRSMSQAGSAGLEDLYDILGLTEQGKGPGSPGDATVSRIAVDELQELIEAIAVGFAKIAVSAPELVRKAFQGRLVEASVGLLRRRACVSPSRTTDLLENLSRFHLADSLLQAAEEASVRIFETTGFAFLDDNGDRKTTKGCILNKMDKQLGSLIAMLKLFAQKVDVNHGDRRLKPFEALAAESRLAALEEAFRSQYGDQSEAEIRRTVRDLVPRVVKMRRGLQTLKGLPGYRSQPAWIDRGPDPMQILFLNCSFAAGWLHDHMSDNDRTDPDFMADAAMPRIRVAIRRAARGESYPPEQHTRDSAKIANRLFFTLRNMRVTDPRCDAHQRMAKDGDVLSLLDAFRTAWAERADQDARARSGRDVENWSPDISSDATAAYSRASAADDESSHAFVSEAQGRIAIRLGRLH